MHHHAPTDYICPICLGIQGIENEHTLLKKNDLVYQDNMVSAFINSFWIPTCEGHVIVVPNEHFENVFDIPNTIGAKVFEVAQKVALAMKKAYQCDGITLRQNSEPAGDQHAFHYHLHVFPRYDGDSFNTNLTRKSVLSEPNDRIAYAEKLQQNL